MKHRKLTAFLTSLNFMIISAALVWLAFQYPEALLYYGMFTGVPGYLLLLMIFTPIGNIRLGAKEGRKSNAKWWGGILKGHLALLILTFVVFLGFFGNGPGFMKPMDFSSGITEIIHYTRMQWGIFPWGIFAFWAVLIAYMTYVKNQPPYVYTIAASAWSRRLEPLIKTFVEAIQFSSTSMVIAVVSVGIILLFSHAIEKYFQISHYTLAPITISFFSIFVFIISLKSTRIAIRHRAHWMSLGYMITMCIIGFVGILVIAAFANQWFVAQYPQLVQLAVCKSCGEFFASASQSVRFASLYWGWWMVWTPLAGSYIASLAKGRTLRELMVGIYLIPGLIWVLGKVSVPAMQVTLPQYSKFVLFTILIFSPAIAWWILAKMLRNVKESDFFYSGFMSLPEKLPRSRIWLQEGSKSVGLGRFSNRVIMLLFGTLFFQIMAGWFGLQIQLLSSGIVMIHLVYWIFLTALYRAFKRG